jgi:hypothetical protein
MPPRRGICKVEGLDSLVDQEDPMTRSIAAALCLLAALTLIMPFVGTADARGAGKKKCLPPDRAQSWVCGAKETCCYDYVLQQGVCTPGKQSCF